MNDTISVLVVDDDSDAALSLVKALKVEQPDISFHAATSVGVARSLFETERPNVAILDLHLEPGRGVESGFALAQQLLSIDSTSRIIVLTGHGSVEHGIRALNLGASSFLEKPADIAHLAALVQDCVAQSRIRRAHAALENSRAEGVTQTLVGNSAAIAAVRTQLVQVSQTLQPVLLVGETGTGKGVSALAIHKLSKRSQRKFVRYQPTFASADLVSSDLFGHAKGAFTGALEERSGLIAESDGGTLFLDEIEELPVETQVALLGVLQEKRVRRVGSDQERAVDFRLICATNADPDADLSNGKLRRDFYHRVAHAVITLPPLRSRIEDIDPLAAHILERLRDRESVNVFEIDAAALAIFRSHSWPGNVRELEAAVEGAAYRALAQGRTTIMAVDVAVPGRAAERRDVLSLPDQIEEYRLKLVREALDKCGGNQVQTAKLLGIDRTSLRRIIERNKRVS
jgi:DNA-binding NtrC family response regulator